jgi:hypothetical protein
MQHCFFCLQAHAHPDIGVAWIRSLALQASGMSLAEIRQVDAELLPAFLVEHYYKVQVSINAGVNVYLCLRVRLFPRQAHTA